MFIFLKSFSMTLSYRIDAAGNALIGCPPHWQGIVDICQNEAGTSWVKLGSGSSDPQCLLSTSKG